MSTTATTGTVKVGRWEYPAEVAPGGTVRRNTKRDGSGDWKIADPASFVPDANGAPDLPAIEGFTDETSVRDELRRLYLYIYDSFSVHEYADVAEFLGSDIPTAKRYIATLKDLGLVYHDPKYSDGSGTTGDMFQAHHTYDEEAREQAVARFNSEVPADVTVKATRQSSGHGSKPGAQTKKPGRSSWAVGDHCPQGHVITDAKGDNPVYVMPSGRKQCRKCRRGYSSNGGE